MKAVAVMVMAEDRPGLAEAFGECVHAAAGNIETSRMVTLGREFVIAALVSPVGSQGIDVLRDSLTQGLTEAGFQVTVRPTDTGSQAQERLAYRLEAVSLDHPGIVEALAETIRAQGGSILDGETESSHAPWSGAPTFRFTARVLVSDAVAGRTLRSSLEDLAAQENLDVTIEPVG